ncbi:MAG: hypothetical protein JWP88_1376 [Flaviaesturariibacter sp.]|nr:hypothetical protein [Flaviaesturariibacter sp.]
MKIKVCGLTSFEQMVELQNLGVDYLGLIFYEGSSRFVGNKLSEQKEAVRDLEMAKVGVFVNADTATISQAISDYGLSAVQLHGDESPEVCAALMLRVSVIKAFRIDDDTNIDAVLAPYNGACNYYLLDTAGTAYGGNGQKFDWHKLDDAIISKLFFLSGGIGPEDANRLRGFYHSFLYAIDINSRFETAPGIKDLALIETFIDRVKQRHDED